MTAIVLVRADDAGIARAAERVRAGEVVAFPTESSYGLAALALDAAALQRLVELKGRAASQRISLLVADASMLAEVTRELPARARALIAAHWPGALTLVLPARAGLAPQLVNEHGGVGVRVSSDPVAQALVRAVGAPITATSANLGGQPAATTAQEASIAGVALVLDDGPRTAAASTVAEVAADGAVTVLRAGPVDVGG
ncbi:MAG: threonylcarbamoyl-AMP synthase [Myxococcales bacterium]|nr:threonylcarbamoyl-AMP synthase [Myxococcales bacterium]